jgi:hypothetical protein
MSAAHLFSIMTPSKCLWMQLRAPLHLVLRASCPPMDNSFMLRTCCHTHRYSFMLRACCHTRFASRAHVGTTFTYAPCRACSWHTYNIIHLLQHTSKSDETFTTYACNICVWALQHMQYPDKTFATYTFETIETYTCNIRV